MMTIEAARLSRNAEKKKEAKATRQSSLRLLVVATMLATDLKPP